MIKNNGFILVGLVVGMFMAYLPGSAGAECKNGCDCYQDGKKARERAVSASTPKDKEQAYTEALKLLQQALAFDPEPGKRKCGFSQRVYYPYLEIGYAYMGMGKLNEAYAAYTQEKDKYEQRKQDGKERDKSLEDQLDFGLRMTKPMSTPTPMLLVKTEAATLEPTATPVPKPTAIPTPEPTAAPKPKAVPTATPVPEPTATPMPKPMATAKPTATPEPGPTATPASKPTVTSKPAAMPTATPTPRPTVTSKPTVTPKPTAASKTTPIPVPTAMPTSTKQKGIQIDTSDVEPGPVSSGEVYAVIIGIGNYADARIPKLKYTVNDAQGFYDILTSFDYGRVPKEHVKLLLDKEATYQNIKSALGTWLKRQAKEDSTVLIYYSGHGAPESDEKYWVTYDANIDDLYSTALSNNEISDMFNRIKAKRMITFLDACYSEATVNRTNQTRAIQSEIPWEKFTGEGRVVISASDGKQLSLELGEFQHGVFTYYLLDGLRGKADQNQDHVVEVDEIWNYVKRQVTDKAQEEGNTQTPVLQGAITAGIPLTVDWRGAIAADVCNRWEKRKQQIVTERVSQRDKLTALFEQEQIQAEHFECSNKLLDNLQFKVTDQVINNLRSKENPEPEEVLKNLEKVKNTFYVAEAEFETALQAALGNDLNEQNACRLKLESLTDNNLLRSLLSGKISSRTFDTNFKCPLSGQ